MCKRERERTDKCQQDDFFVSWFSVKLFTVRIQFRLDICTLRCVSLISMLRKFSEHVHLMLSSIYCVHTFSSRSLQTAIRKRQVLYLKVHFQSGFVSVSKDSKDLSIFGFLGFCTYRKKTNQKLQIATIPVDKSKI